MPDGEWWSGADRQAGRIALSLLEHYDYCPRQAALIHIDGRYVDNVETLRGTFAHERVHTPTPPPYKPPAGSRIVTGMPVWSDSLGLYGICDAVEMAPATLVPVEHKVGRYVAGGPADVQAAAQALCLREMQQDREVPHAAVYSYADRRRHRVELTTALTGQVHAVAELATEMLGRTLLPPAVNDRRCRRCSLEPDCLPLLTARPPTVDLFDPQPLGRWDD